MSRSGTTVLERPAIGMEARASVRAYTQMVPRYLYTMRYTAIQREERQQLTSYLTLHKLAYITDALLTTQE
jgi:hypothetical protein